MAAVQFLEEALRRELTYKGLLLIFNLMITYQIWPKSFSKFELANMYDTYVNITRVPGKYLVEDNAP